MTAKTMAPGDPHWRNDPRPGDKVPVLCWCERKVIRVPLIDVRHGLTGSCGAKGCEEE